MPMPGYQVRGQLNKRTEPLEGEIKLLEMIGAGLTVAEAAAELEISWHTAQDRLDKLKYLWDRKGRLPPLVYEGLVRGAISYQCYGFRRPDTRYIDIVRGLAQGLSPQRICRSLCLTEGQYDRRIRNARREVGARNQSNLVAIYYTEGWIK